MKRLGSSAIALGCAALAGCTGQLMDSFRFEQQEQNFASSIDVNTKIDLLWVVDNSSSMDVSQKSLRDKFRNFALQYLKPYWDIRLAVITTDTYGANPVFTRFSSEILNGSVGYRSFHLADYIQRLNAKGGSRTAEENRRLSLLSGMGVSIAGTLGVFNTGFAAGNQYPLWQQGANYAKLKAGIHDGPIPGLCIERSPYFIAGDTAAVEGPQCILRDESNDVSADPCISPGVGQTSVNQCVNTTLNDSVRSGKAILETKIASDWSGSSDAWVEDLVDKFTINISAGSSGSGSERGLGSVTEFMRVNEADSSTRFFRQGAVHGIIFLTDEDDQTMALPSAASVASGEVFTPETHYVCDTSSLVDANIIPGVFDTAGAAQSFIETTMGYCCTGVNCSYKPKSCPVKTVGSLSYRVSTCPDTTLTEAQGGLVSVSSVKTQFENFFQTLEGSGANPNYFVSVITPLTEDTINTLQSARFDSDDRLKDLHFYSRNEATPPYTYADRTSRRVRVRAVDIGTRYIELVNAMGSDTGSNAYDIGEPDYSTILDDIGLTLVQKKSHFPLNREATDKHVMTILIVKKDGTQIQVRDDQYELPGREVVITDIELVLSLESTDQIVINYQPSSEAS